MLPSSGSASSSEMSGRNTKCTGSSAGCRWGCFYSLEMAHDLTHCREELSHLVWVALLAGCKYPQQTFQTQQGQTGPLLLLPCVLHHAGDVGVPPHEHTAKTIRCWISPPSNVTEATRGARGFYLVMSQRKRKVLSEFCPSGPSVFPVSSSCWIFCTATLTEYRTNSPLERSTESASSLLWALSLEQNISLIMIWFHICNLSNQNRTS